MSIDRSRFSSIALITIVGMLAVSPVTAGASGDRASTTAGRCTMSGKGTAWSSGGKKGTAYTVVGDRRSACALGIKWLVRLTNMQGVPKTPPGWECITAVAATGQCSSKSGGTFEWIAKTRG